MRRGPSVREELRQIDRQRGARSRRPIKAGARPPDDRSIRSFGELPDLDRARIGIDDPVLPHAVVPIALQLGASVAIGSRRRKNLDHQVGRAFDTSVAEQMSAVGPNEDDVGLEVVAFGEEHVEGPGKRLTEVVPVHEVRDLVQEPADDPLMTHAG